MCDKSFHQFTIYVRLYETASKNDRASWIDALRLVLGQNELTVCANKANSFKTHDVIRLLTYGLGENLDRVRKRLSEKLNELCDLEKNLIDPKRIDHRFLLANLDDWYIFASLDDCSGHKDIATGKIVTTNEIKNRLSVGDVWDGTMCRTCVNALLRLARTGLCPQLYHRIENHDATTRRVISTLVKEDKSENVTSPSLLNMPNLENVVETPSPLLRSALFSKVKTDELKTVTPFDEKKSIVKTNGGKTVETSGSNDGTNDSFVTPRDVIATKKRRRKHDETGGVSRKKFLIDQNDQATKSSSTRSRKDGRRNVNENVNNARFSFVNDDSTCDNVLNWNPVNRDLFGSKPFASSDRPTDLTAMQYCQTLQEQIDSVTEMVGLSAKN